MNMNNLLSAADTKAVFEILKQQLDVREDQCTPEARIEHDLGADSLDMIEIVMMVEERFGIVVPDEKAEQVSTVHDLFEVLAELRRAPTQCRG